MSKCWVDANSDIDDSLIKDRYHYKCFPRESCKGGGLTVIYKKELHDFLCVEKIVNESVLWLKIHKGISVENNDLYIGFVYLPHENNVFYRKNDIDFFNILNVEIEKIRKLYFG